ncbi:sporulation-specific cell division protein SsgB [Streptomyces hygroscopicus subsp. hygroscopicus]|nr:SsgA family sporulation/cell division regulator [Streptomyces hygroscopicus]GLX49159.1 sporulation-specific cell division protein SsgB [Streptomyces hygroscopicus subsp. hygroscopicus]
MSKCGITVQITHWVGRRFPVPIACEFSYDSADPLAVTMILDSDGEYPVRWVFARELMTEGLTARSGQGEVEIWPTHSEGQRALWVRVANARTRRTAFFEMPAQPIAQWLASSYALVPRGREMAEVNWDKLAQLIQ